MALDDWELQEEGNVQHILISLHQLRACVESLELGTRRTYAVLEPKAGGSYYQCAGDGGGMLLEKRVGDGPMLRAVVEKGLARSKQRPCLSFSAGDVELRPDEWLRRAQVVAILSSVVSDEGEPTWLSWRDISDRVAL